MLYYSAPDDLQNPEKLRTLLKDIREARQAKSRDGLSKLDHNELMVCSLQSYILVQMFKLYHSCRTSVRWRSTRSVPSSFAGWACLPN